MEGSRIYQLLEHDGLDKVHTLETGYHSDAQSYSACYMCMTTLKQISPLNMYIKIMTIC